MDPRRLIAPTMKLPQFTLRRAMHLVALVALILGTFVGLRQRTERLHRIAQAHAREAQGAADTAWGFQRFGINADGTVPEDQAKQAEHYWQVFSQHKALSEKYELAAKRPWLPD
jgi:hypothetical protein